MANVGDTGSVAIEVVQWFERHCLEKSPSRIGSISFPETHLVEPAPLRLVEV